jgi:2,5-diamino-6-(ribosylamino)-4(3H)-pyrimidinone 5'-phosphate reductase
METLKNEYHVERITIQSGGTLNERFLREKLFDYINVVIAPILIGGKETPSLIDGNSITKASQLNLLGALKLEECNVLEDSYIQLKYKVI